MTSLRALDRDGSRDTKLTEAWREYGHKPAEQHAFKESPSSEGNRGTPARGPASENVRGESLDRPILDCHLTTAP